MSAKVKFEDFPGYGEVLIPLEEWKEDVRSRRFIDYDGSGKLATSTKTSNLRIIPSDLADFKFPKWCTHILWFNR